jgi:hypothetical protein
MSSREPNQAKHIQVLDDQLVAEADVEDAAASLLEVKLG